MGVVEDIFVALLAAEERRNSSSPRMSKSRWLLSKREICFIWRRSSAKDMDANLQRRENGSREDVFVYLHLYYNSL